MKENFENYYEKISSQLAAIEFFIEPPQFEIYNPRLFSEDWLNNKLYDWEDYLSTMLDIPIFHLEGWQSKKMDH